MNFPNYVNNINVSKMNEMFIKTLVLNVLFWKTYSVFRLVVHFFNILVDFFNFVVEKWLYIKVVYNDQII